MKIIETERLRMRPLTRADVDRWLELHADPEVGEFLGTYTRESALERLGSIEEEWASRGFSHFALERKDTGEFLGRCGLKYWKEFDEVGIGAALLGKHRGKGYLVEAAQAYIAWGFNELKIDHMIATVRDDNESSLNLVKALGFRPQRPAELFGHPITIYVRYRSD